MQAQPSPPGAAGAERHSCRPHSCRPQHVQYLSSSDTRAPQLLQKRTPGAAAATAATAAAAAANSCAGGHKGIACGTAASECSMNAAPWLTAAAAADAPAAAVSGVTAGTALALATCLCCCSWTLLCSSAAWLLTCKPEAAAAAGTLALAMAADGCLRPFSSLTSGCSSEVANTPPSAGACAACANRCVTDLAGATATSSELTTAL